MLSAATTSLANNANTLFPHRDDWEAATGYVLPPLSADSEPGGTFQTSVSWGSVPFLGIGARVTIVPPTPTQASASVGCWRLLNVGPWPSYAWPNSWERQPWRPSVDGRYPQQPRWLLSAGWPLRWWGRSRSAAWRRTPRCTNLCRRRIFRSVIAIKHQWRGRGASHPPMTSTTFGCGDIGLAGAGGPGQWRKHSRRVQYLPDDLVVDEVCISEDQGAQRRRNHRAHLPRSVSRTP